MISININRTRVYMMISRQFSYKHIPELNRCSPDTKNRDSIGDGSLDKRRKA
jgi:hypothetical protein